MKKPLWQPGAERIERSNLVGFMQLVNDRFGTDFSEYHQLYDWSVENLEEFWALMWDYGDIKASEHYQEVLVNAEDMFNSRWFEGARLNFAENLLRYRDNKPAIIFAGENQKTQTITYRELYREVARFSRAL